MGAIIFSPCFVQFIQSHLPFLITVTGPVTSCVTNRSVFARRKNQQNHSFLLKNIGTAKNSINTVAVASPSRTITGMVNATNKTATIFCIIISLFSNQSVNCKMLHKVHQPFQCKGCFCTLQTHLLFCLSTLRILDSKTQF